MSEQAFQGTRNTVKRETITERFEQFNESNHSLITLIGMSNLTHQIRFDCVQRTVWPVRPHRFGAALGI